MLTAPAPAMQVATVQSQLSSLDRLITQRARQWSRSGAGDEDDLAQEGRVALLDALPRYDPTQASLTTYANRVLSSKFGNILRDVLRWKRRPHIVDHTPDGSRAIACPTLSLDAPAPAAGGDHERGRLMDSPLVPPASIPDPEAVAMRVEHLRTVSRVLARVRAQLTPTEVQVLDAYLRPSTALLVTARNLGTTNNAEIQQIAIFLGLSKATVDGALRRVRRLAVIAARVEAS